MNRKNRKYFHTQKILLSSAAPNFHQKFPPKGRVERVLILRGPGMELWGQYSTFSNMQMIV